MKDEATSSTPGIGAFEDWIGREQTVEDVAAPATVVGLAGLLDHTAPPWVAGELPPLAHWLYFLPRERQSLLDVDGHPKRGDFLPPVPLPRRMWVGSRIHFLAPIPVGSDMRRRSTIVDVAAKTGRMGRMVFVTLRHEIIVQGTVAITEQQDIVYRDGAAAASAAPQVAVASAAVELSCVSQATRVFTPDPVNLFRFSALTFNAHRIHYDRDYARDQEGYPGLVVHGPLVATLLMDHLLRRTGPVSVRSFTFRAVRPLFDSSPFDLCLALYAGGAELWAGDGGTDRAFTATAEYS